MSACSFVCCCLRVPELWFNYFSLSIETCLLCSLKCDLRLLDSVMFSCSSVDDGLWHHTSVTDLADANTSTMSDIHSPEQHSITVHASVCTAVYNSAPPSMTQL